VLLFSDDETSTQSTRELPSHQHVGSHPIAAHILRYKYMMSSPYLTTIMRSIMQILFCLLPPKKPKPKWTHNRSRSPLPVHITWYTEYEEEVGTTHDEMVFAKGGLASVERDLACQERDVFYGPSHPSTRDLRNNIRAARRNLKRIEEKYEWLEGEARRLKRVGRTPYYKLGNSDARRYGFDGMDMFDCQIHLQGQLQEWIETWLGEVFDVDPIPI
jgi:hypothetical protein